jgi:hypothetical protein
MPPRLILHIGTEKTGTTALQYWLRDHKEELASHGVGLPSSLGPTNHRRLPTSCFDLDRIDDFVIRSGLASDADLRHQAYSQWQASFLDEAVHSDLPLWVVSSEHCSSRLTRESELHRLKALLDRLGRAVEVVLYIREPLQTAISAWSTLVLNGGVPLEALPEPDHPLLQDKCNHRLLVERWQRLFPSLRVRLYSRRLIEDFCDLIGVSGCSEFSGEPAHDALNRSLPHAAIVQIAQLNRAYPVYTGTQLNPERERRIADIMAATAGLEPYRPTSIEQSSFSSYYADSCEWVRLNFFPHRSMLFD